MSVLETAKGIQRQAAQSANITIRLALLEDLIAEIERLHIIERADQLLQDKSKLTPLERAAFKEAKP